jgi:hypothetical protein
VAGFGEDEAVLGTEGSAFAVDGLRGGDDDFSEGHSLVADDLEHLGCAEAVDLDILSHLRHVAAVGSLVEDDVYTFECRSHGLPVTDVGVQELGLGWYPGRLAVAVGLGFEVVEDAHPVTLLQEQVG